MAAGAEGAIDIPAAGLYRQGLNNFIQVRPEHDRPLLAVLQTFDNLIFLFQAGGIFPTAISAYPRVRRNYLRRK